MLLQTVVLLQPQLRRQKRVDLTVTRHLMLHHGHQHQDQPRLVAHLQ